MSRNPTSRSQVIIIHDLLKRTLSRIEEKDKDGRHLVVYDGNWSDETVAKECGVSSTVVRSLRNELFGLLRKVRTPDEIQRDQQRRIEESTTVRDRLIALENVVKDMRELLNLTTAHVRILYNKLGEDLPD